MSSEIRALRNVAVKARAFREACCRVVRELPRHGEVDYDRTAGALDGALQALQDIERGKRA